MRLLAVLLCMLVALPIAAQERERTKKPAVKKQKQLAHKKPTPEQIRKFNELESKRKKD